MKYSALGIALLAFALPFSAGAAVKKDGAWPPTDKTIDLSFDGRPSEGLKKLAKEAGWSLVVADAASIDSAGDVHVAVEDQRADAVLEALFVGRDVVAQRNGKLVTITLHGDAPSPVASAPAVAEPAAPPPLPVAPPAPTTRGKDRSVLGGSLVIQPNETVHTVTVTGGSLTVRGNVTGDLVVLGGSANVESQAHVVGNATVFGGRLRVQKGAHIDGDVAITGGGLDREDGAVIGGRVVDNDSAGNEDDDDDEHDKKSAVIEGEKLGAHSRVWEAVHEFGASMTRIALLFVLGCVLLALLAPRMDRLRVEIAARPMRSFAIGLLGSLAGVISLTVLATILCITIIGIPIAVLGVLLLVVAVYGSVAAALTTFGAAVAGHRTDNPYVHLLIGCGAFLLLSSIPWLGGLVTFGVVWIGIGALIATRAGGLLQRKTRAAIV